MATTDTITLAAEYHALTEGCGLVDRSERGKLALTGADAVEFLNGQVTNELLDLQPGEGRYAAFLTHKGKMLGDLRVLAVDEPEGPPSELLLDTERVALQALFDTIRRFKVGYEVELHKRTLQASMLSLIGPASAPVLARGFDLAESDLPAREHDHIAIGTMSGPADDEPAGEALPTRAVRTDLGFDVICDARAGPAARAALVHAGATTVSEAAAEIVRVERGRPRFGIDIDETTIPQEAGLNERAVSFTKGCYVGQETVARLFYKGKPNRHLRGLYLPADPHPLASPGAELTFDGRPVGRVGSSVVSPARGPIGLALIRREAEPNSQVEVAGTSATAVVVELPFQ